MSDLLRLPPPGSRPAELHAAECLLGALMVWPEVLDQIPHVRPEDFYQAKDAHVFGAALRLWRDGRPCDVQSLCVAMEKAGTLEAAGGISRLADLAASIPSKASVKHYARVVTDAAAQRALVLAGHRIASMAQEAPNGVEHLRGEVDRLVDEALARRGAPRATRVGDVAGEVLAWLAEPERGISTGFPELDSTTSGLQPEELTLLAARPSMGKTSLAVRILRNMAVAGVPCALFSLEVPKRQIVVNLAAQELRISALRIRKDNLSGVERHDLLDLLEVFRDWPLTVDDTPGVTVEDVVSTTRMLVREQGIRVVAVDYVQLLAPAVQGRSRAEEVGHCSTRLKQLARECGIAVLATAQINRTAEQRKGAKPLMSDLKDSGNLEQDADAVWLLHRPEYYDRDNADLEGVAYVDVAKNRNGPTGNVRLGFRKECMLFESVAAPSWLPPKAKGVAT